MSTQYSQQSGGALRAVRAIESLPYPLPHSTVKAETIDRETGLPDLIFALAFIVNNTNAKNQFMPDAPMSEAAAVWAKALKQAREALNKARGNQ